MGLGLLLLAGCGEKVFYLGEAGTDAGRGLSAVGPEPPLQLLWQRKMDGPPIGGVLFAGSLALQLTTSPSLHAFDRYSGSSLGKQGYDEALCGPGVLSGKMLFLGELGDEAGLRALDRRTLAERWRQRGVFCRTPVVRGDTLVAAGEDSALWALDATKGSQLWRTVLDGRMRVGPALSGDLVYVGTAKGTLVALEMASGQQRWSVELGEALRSRPLALGSKLWVATASGRIVALRADTGAVIWERGLGSLLTQGLALGAGVLVAGCVDRYFYGLDAETGEVRWSFATEGVVRSSPVVTAQTVYCASSDGHLYALELASGRMLWKYRLDGPVLTPVTLGEGVIGVATEERTLYVFGRR